MNILSNIQLIWKRIFVVIVFIICGLLSAQLFTSRQQPFYQTSGTIELKSQQVNEENRIKEKTANNLDEIIATECEKIASFPIISEAIKQLNIKGENSYTENNVKLIQYIKEHSSVKRIEGTNIIQVTLNYNDPEKIASIVNKIIEIYIDKKNSEKNNRYQKIREELEKQLNTAKDELTEAETEFSGFSKKNKGASNIEMLKSKLVDLRLELSKLSRKFNYKHPEIIDLNNQIQITEKELNLSNERNVKIDTLEKNIALRKETYDSLNNKLNDTIFQESGNDEMVRLVSPAMKPSETIYLHRNMNFSVGGLTGLLIGILLSIKIKSRKLLLETIEEIENKLQIPVVGVIPHIKKPSKEFYVLNNSIRKNKLLKNLFIYFPKKALATEAYYTLWTDIKFTIPEQHRKTFLFTSEKAGEGKTLTAVNCALAISSIGLKTLLVESDHIHPVIHKIFNLKKGPGLSEIITEQQNWKNCLNDLNLENGFSQKNLDTYSNLKIITYGKNLINPMQVFDSPGMDVFIESVKKEFDLILFDSSPLLLTTEPIILASKTDNLIIVNRAENISEDSLLRIKIQLENSNANILGIIINDANISEIHHRHKYFKKDFKYSAKEEFPSLKPAEELSILTQENEVRKVLIVDDESSIVNVITRTLLKKSKYNYEIASANNGFDALKQFDKFKPNLVVLDLKLPGIDGYQICEKIRSNYSHKDVKILAITGYDDPGVKKRIFDCGADEYIAKPFDLTKFMECINNLPV